MRPLARDLADEHTAAPIAPIETEDDLTLPIEATPERELARGSVVEPLEDQETCRHVVRTKRHAREALHALRAS